MTEPRLPGDPGETLDLADWRRRVADLYAEVRRLSVGDVAAALELWRSTRETVSCAVGASRATRDAAVAIHPAHAGTRGAAILSAGTSC